MELRIKTICDFVACDLHRVGAALSLPFRLSMYLYMTIHDTTLICKAIKLAYLCMEIHTVEGLLKPSFYRTYVGDQSDEFKMNLSPSPAPR